MRRPNRKPYKKYNKRWERERELATIEKGDYVRLDCAFGRLRQHIPYRVQRVGYDWFQINGHYVQKIFCSKAVLEEEAKGDEEFSFSFER